MKTVLAAVAIGALALATLLLRPSKPAEPAVRFDVPSPHPVRTAAARAVVYVAGKVMRPGLYTLDSGARIDDAIRAAGGIARDGDPVAVNLAEHVTDGEEVVVPALGADPPPPAARRAAHRRSRKSAHPKRRRQPLPAAEVDLNQAGADRLAQLPGVDEALARRIVEVRHLDGPFTSIDDLADVAGMSNQKLHRLAPLVVIRSR